MGKYVHCYCFVFEVFPSFWTMLSLNIYIQIYVRGDNFQVKIQVKKKKTTPQDDSNHHII